jgi:hypothetical protein
MLAVKQWVDVVLPRIRDDEGDVKRWLTQGRQGLMWKVTVLMDTTTFASYVKWSKICLRE